MSEVLDRADKEPREPTTRIRPHGYAEFIRLDTLGLESCGGDCTRRWPLGRCEHHEVEHRLGYAIDPRRPSAVAIREALLLVAEQCDYESADDEKAILKACNEGHISPETCSRLLEEEDGIHERDLAAVAFELLTTRNGWSRIGSSAPRRWRTDLDADEEGERRRLQELRFNGGFTREDNAVYHKLTEPQPVEPIDWNEHPRGLRDEAEAVLANRRSSGRGELPRYVRSARGRSYLPTFEAPSFRRQIGPIAKADTPAKIGHAVANYRRAAKRLGRFPPDHDRRRGNQTCAD
jgi:hypothetical protein